MRTDTKHRKHAGEGLRAISGEQQWRGVLMTRQFHSGKQACPLAGLPAIRLAGARR
jgi:hypothetical protein